MKLTFLITIFQFALLTVFSQTNEPPATIETLEGTFINGKIRYGSWTVIPPFVEFIEKGELKRIYPSSIKGFTVNNEQYIAHTVTFHKGSLDMQLLPDNYNDETVTQTVFLKLLVKGTYRLYYYANESRQYYFIQKPGDLPEELLYRLKMKDRLLGEDKTYQTQLAGFAENAALDAVAVQKAYQLNYSATELSRYVNQINGGKSIVSAEKSNRLYVNVEGGAGVMMPLYSAKGDAIVAPINTIDAESSAGAVVHAGFLISKDPAYSFSRWLVQFRYSSFNVSGRSQTVTSGPDAYYEQYDFSVAQFNAGLGLMQLFTKEKAPVKFYGSVTGNVGFLLSKPGDTKLIRASNGSLLTTYSDYPKLNKVGVTAIVSAGCAFSRFRAEVFYQSPFRISAQNRSNFSASAIGVSLRAALRKY